MNDRDDILQQLKKIIAEYSSRLEIQFSQTWEKLPIDLSINELFETTGALLARQVTLATQFAEAPQIWNSHSAPLFLRAMCDVYISLAWILKEPAKRSKQFIEFGLGQQKLAMEQRRIQVESEGKKIDDDLIYNATEAWLNSQKWTFLTPVNVGSWSEISTRKMAEEAGCLDFYRYSYTPFSAAVHSMWHHVARFNLKPCTNPLHMLHKIPDLPDLGIDPFYFQLTAKYAQKLFKLIESHFNLTNIPSTRAWLDDEINSVFGISTQSKEADDATA